MSLPPEPRGGAERRENKSPEKTLRVLPPSPVSVSLRDMLEQSKRYPASGFEGKQSGDPQPVNRYWGSARLWPAGDCSA